MNFVQSQDTMLKVGVPSRTLQTSTSFYTEGQTTGATALFGWDADRDETKRIIVDSKVTQNDKTKVEFGLNIPFISKEVKIAHEMQMNRGRTLWDGKTDLSYSPDARKTLTVASSLKDVSEYT